MSMKIGISMPAARGGRSTGGRQPSPPRPDSRRPVGDAGHAKASSSPPRPGTREEVPAVDSVRRRAASERERGLSPARSDKRLSPPRPTVVRAGRKTNGDVQSPAKAAGEAEVKEVKDETDVLLERQCRELAAYGVGPKGLKALREVHKELRVEALAAFNRAIDTARPAASRDELWNQVLSEATLALVGPAPADAPPPPPSYPEGCEAAAHGSTGVAAAYGQGSGSEVHVHGGHGGYGGPIMQHHEWGPGGAAPPPHAFGGDRPYGGDAAHHYAGGAGAECF